MERVTEVRVKIRNIASSKEPCNLMIIDLHHRLA